MPGVIRTPRNAHTGLPTWSCILPLLDNHMPTLERARIYAQQALAIPAGIEVSFCLTDFASERECHKVARSLQQAFYGMKRREWLRVQRIDPNAPSPFGPLSAVLRKSPDGLAWTVRFVQGERVDADLATVRRLDTGEIIHHLSNTPQGQEEEAILEEIGRTRKLSPSQREWLERNNPTLLENVLFALGLDKGNG